MLPDYYYSIIVLIKFRRISFPKNCVVVFDFVPTARIHTHTHALLLTEFDRFTPPHPLSQLFLKYAARSLPSSHWNIIIVKKLLNILIII